MRSATLVGSWAVAIALTITGCEDSGGDPIELGEVSYFNGMVYDGATGKRLPAYNIKLTYLDREEQGDVDANGYFLLGPLEAMNDYTVSIEAEGYRSFLSHNAAVGPMGQTFYYDAYLFPKDLSVPSVNFNIALMDSEKKPSGFLRLQPTAPSLLYDDATERPAGVAGQVWDNDEDLQFNTLTLPFENGKVSVDGKKLVYGVSYAVTTFGVPGYQPSTGAFKAGMDGEQGIMLSPLARTPIALAFHSDSVGADPSGRLVLVFNVPVEFDPPSKEATYREIIDGSLDIVTDDDDDDGRVNLLVDDKSPKVAERGTQVTLSGTTLTLQWNRASALATIDQGDAITAVVYGGFDAVSVRPVGTDSSQSVSLDSLIGASSVSVSLVP